MEPFPAAQTAARWLAAELAPKLLRAETAPSRSANVCDPAGATGEVVAGRPRPFADQMTLSRSGPLFLLFLSTDSESGLLRRTPRLPSSEGSTSPESMARESHY